MDPTKFGGEFPGTLVSDQGFVTYNPDPLPPDLEFSRDLIVTLSEARGAIGELAGIGQMIQESQRLLLGPFIRREAVFSSRIEGTYATVSDVYAHEAGQESAISEAGRSDVSEIRNYIRATHIGLSRISNEPFSTDLITDLHGMLLEDVRGGTKSPGEFRDDQNAIGSHNPSEARYVPPPAHTVPYEVETLVEYINGEHNHDPLIDIALAHYQFETIHPFFDGNGRMGRLLITLMLQKRGLLPQPFLYFSSFFNMHRDEYIQKLYDVNTKGAWEAWISFFLAGVIDQSKEVFLRSKKLVELRDEYRDSYIDRRSETILSIVYELFQNPIITINLAAERAAVQYHPARTAIRELEADGVLEEITGKERYQVYRATEIMNVIEEPIERLVDDVGTEFDRYRSGPVKGGTQQALDDF